ncbi:hypothetical protein A0256_07900 [Mucilaginibacter sp. PAMC 26640]|nr:hypothetical protein A0256_07900 [Mucilaginibacter sp. PAMC 26640]
MLNVLHKPVIFSSIQKLEKNTRVDQPRVFYKAGYHALITQLQLARIIIATGLVSTVKYHSENTSRLLSKTREGVLKSRTERYKQISEIDKNASATLDAMQNQVGYNFSENKLESLYNPLSIIPARPQWEFDRSKTQLNNVKLRAEMEIYKRNTVIIGLMLIMVISGLIFNSQRLHAQKDRALLTSEKVRLDEQLRTAELAIAGYAEKLTQKNLLIDEFKTELDKLKRKFNAEDGAREIANMMKLHIMTDENWEEFKKLFSNVHPAFLYNLRNKYPHVTSTEIRLLALLKLNLNNREMAGMLGITTDGVKKAKQRLRKKIKLEGSLELEDIIKGL